MVSSQSCPVLSNALPLPIFRRLASKRVVLASSSPRRKDLLEAVGFKPEIIPSTFAEDLPKSSFHGRLADYPIATAGEKAMEVYERLIKIDDKNPADLVISGDTVVIFPPERDTVEGGVFHGEMSEIFEKPISKVDQLRTLSLMAGRACEVVTGVTIVYPTVEAPGYKLESISCSTIVHFGDNSLGSQKELLEAYVESHQGIDRAGGFTIQGVGGLLVERVEGSYDNAIGFPSSAFWRWMSELDASGVFSEAWDA
ncbi:MAG: hypothetical protein TREMPRED_003155 [Tremellales sp. Tagirdzhanova-0007]|nr:MAG: hypothetical protein TREMPRED_003155 [Tremellales sp. Tagirdzhanova-0007]